MPVAVGVMLTDWEPDPTLLPFIFSTVGVPVSAELNVAISTALCTVASSGTPDILMVRV